MSAPVSNNTVALGKMWRMPSSMLMCAVRFHLIIAVAVYATIGTYYGDLMQRLRERQKVAIVLEQSHRLPSGL